ncbi:MAG: ABC transporter substrate-binding protein [Betaproteobacteria bacterium]
MTSRRRFLLALGAAAATPSLVAHAQPAARIPHVGYLSVGSEDTNSAFLSAFKEGLREFGYVDGKNIVVDVQWAGEAAYQFPQLAASMVKTKPDAIVTTCIPSTRAAKAATGTIPLVMSVDGDPVGAGLVTSLARPGANLTGSSTQFEELIPKWLELLTAVVPGARAIAILRNPVNLVDPYFWAKFEDAAKRIGVTILPYEARVPGDLVGAFAAINRQRAGGLIVMTEAFLAGESARIVPLADQYKLPGIYGYREFTEAGGLMSYGLSFRDYFRGVARYVDAVLRGTKPANLPIEQPTKIELVINLATARRLGLTMPPTLLARADRVIQ